MVVAEDMTLSALARECLGPLVPAVSVGVLTPEGMTIACEGSACLSPEQPNTPRTRFEIGSTQKVWTATAVMRLVDRGRCTLDTLVRDVLPDFELGGGAGRDISLRHLLTHTSGIPSMVGETGGESIAEVVAQLPGYPQVAPTGSVWEYSNAGYVVLGAVLEVLTGLPFADALDREVREPLQATGASDGAPAIGHMTAGGSDLQAQAPGRFPGFAPAGSTPTGTVEGQLRSVYPHLHAGLAPDGPRFLSAEAVHAMRQRHTDVPVNTEGKVGWGLGWAHYRLADGRTVLGHGGSTYGFCSYLVASPDDEFAVAILMNSLDGISAMSTLGDRVLTGWLGSPLST